MPARAALRSTALLAAVLLAWSPAGAQERTFSEGCHGEAELKYVEGLPILSVGGSPEEIGEQVAALTADATRPLMKFPRRMLDAHGLGRFWPLVTNVAEGMLRNAPEAHRQELDATVKHAQLPRDAIVVANSLVELRRMGGCSTLFVDGQRSATGGPLLGRNLDLDPMGVIHKYSLVIVCRPEGKSAFVSIGFPGLCGVLSGINEHGLAVATLDVYSSRDGSSMFNPTGTPLAFCFRQLLEECKTVDEASQALAEMRRTTWMNLAVCDSRGGAVLEITPRNVLVRSPRDGVQSCTNHFRTRQLATFTGCRRYAALEGARRQEKVSRADVAGLLHAANQGTWTLQTMIFEPAELKLHLALGAGPTSARRLTALDLKPLLGVNE